MPRLPLEIARRLNVEYGVKRCAGGWHAVDFSTAPTRAQPLQRQ